MPPDHDLDPVATPARVMPETPLEELTAEQFDDLVEAAIDRLPAALLDGLDNVAIFVDDIHPEAGLELLGLYEGFNQTERGDYGVGEMPDQITLYRSALLHRCLDVTELSQEIYVTLVHEISHFYGFDEDELDRLGWA